MRHHSTNQWLFVRRVAASLELFSPVFVVVMATVVGVFVGVFGVVVGDGDVVVGLIGSVFETGIV